MSKPLQTESTSVQSGRTRPWLIALCLLLLLSPWTVTAQTNAAIPAAGEILKSLHQGHPRLLANADQFSALKKRAASDAQLRGWYAQLRAEEVKIISEPPSKYEIPDGLRLLGTSRRVLHRMQTLGLVYQLNGDKRCVERAWQELEAAANFPDWNPRHFLDTAEMTHAFAIGYDWFYEAWTPEQRKTIRTAMIEKGLRPALNVYRGNPKPSGQWSKTRHNWNQVCNGGIGIGALAIAEEEPALAGELLNAGLNSIQIAMAEFAPDGAWEEGPGYWNYATTYNIALLAALESALGTDFGLSKIPGFAACGLFPIYATGPFGKTFNYADGGDGTIRAPHMFWLAKKFNRPEYAAYQRHVITQAHALDLLWFDRELADAQPALSLDTYFRNADIVTMRSAWNDRDALFAGFKAGDNKANHSHLDLGSFVFDALGKRWAIDLGAENYNLPGYFGKARWTFYRLRAEGQNALVLNPGAGPDQDPAAAARLERFESKPARAFAIADLTPAYAKHARSVRRGIALLDRERLLVQDEVRADAPVDTWWFMHTPAEIEIASDGRTATLRQGKARLRAELLSPTAARFEIRSAEPLPGSPNPERQNRNAGIRKLTIHVTDARELRLSVLLAPLREGRASAVAPGWQDLAEW